MGKTLVLCLLTGAISLAAVEEKNRREERFTLPPGVRKVVIDGATGSITARGRQGNDVLLVVQERWRADDATAMAEARRDVKLDITQQGNLLRVYVDGPFRCNHGCNHSRDRDYDVRFDFDIDLPRDAEVEFRTVNGGRVKVNGIDGDFLVRNVNGSIELSEMGGSGTANTVNGSVRATFREVPKRACSFKSVNGELRAEFPPGFAADISAKNLHGAILTDFETTALPSRADVRGEREGARYVYRSHGAARVRIGQGGPEHRFETLNGDIEIAKRGSK